MPSATLLTANGSVTPGSSFTTASVSPTAERWLVIDTWGRDDAGTIPQPTFTGLSLSWIVEASKLDGSTDHRVTRAYAWTGTSPGSGTIVVTYGSNTMDGGIWVVYNLSSDVDSSDPFVQSVTAEQAGGLSLTVTLAAFGDPANRPLMCAAHRANEGSTPEAGYTEIGDATTAGPVEGLASQYNSTTADLTPTYSWATTGSDPQLGIASEMRAAAAGGTIMDPFGMSGFFGA